VPSAAKNIQASLAHAAEVRVFNRAGAVVLALLAEKPVLAIARVPALAAVLVASTGLAGKKKRAALVAVLRANHAVAAVLAVIVMNETLAAKLAVRKITVHMLPP